jgi:hypothetical protein
MKMRVVDFRWYHSTLTEFGVSYSIRSKSLSIEAWLARTFNLILITAVSGNPTRPVI